MGYFNLDVVAATALVAVELGAAELDIPSTLHKKTITEFVTKKPGPWARGGVPMVGSLWCSWAPGKGPGVGPHVGL